MPDPEVAAAFDELLEKDPRVGSCRGFLLGLEGSAAGRTFWVLGTLRPCLSLLKTPHSLTPSLSPPPLRQDIHLPWELHRVLLVFNAHYRDQTG
jgi:hypothetical protein